MWRLFQIISFLLILIVNFSQINCFSKFGRGCNDIGCPPGQICIITEEICQIGQRKGTECGAYPTCKKIGNPKQPVIQESRVKPIASSNVRNSPPKANIAWYNNPIIKHHNPPPTVVSQTRKQTSSSSNSILNTNSQNNVQWQNNPIYQSSQQISGSKINTSKTSEKITKKPSFFRRLFGS